MAILQTLTSRKFFLVMLLVVIATAFVFIGKAEFKEWSFFTEIIGGGYLFGNIAEKFVKPKTNGNEV